MRWPVTAELIAPDSEEFGALFRSFAHSVFRLETLQVYRGPRDLDLLNQFLDGKPRPPDPAKTEWTTMITSNVQAGKAVQRVHVVLDPLTDYLRFELTWGYEPNAAAGEDIRIIPLSQGDPWPADVPQHDYWLFDSAGLYDMHYDRDGVWLGAEHVIDPVKIVDACRWRDAALHLGMPWATYVRSNSHLTPHLSDSPAAPPRPRVGARGGHKGGGPQTASPPSGSAGRSRGCLGWKPAPNFPPRMTSMAGSRLPVRATRP